MDGLSNLFGLFFWMLLIYGVYNIHRHIRRRNTPADEAPRDSAIHVGLPPFLAGEDSYRVVFSPGEGKVDRVGVRVCDTIGRPLRTLVEDGPHDMPLEVVWDGRDASGRMVDPGVYLLLFEADGVTRVSVLVRA
ncbi:MAG: hypothetical protein JW819_02305 [Candidatus Krumholzibacteriota bacterium]|nr:hypothetical protein [Candidatus Krumholzibacteriota bacterium]